MSLCDKCVKRDVCYVESKDKESLVYCASYLEERPHGEWIEERLDKYKKYKITCPFCKMEYVDNYDGYIDAIDFNFCPNCGASMRVKDELNRVNNELNSEPKDSHAEYWNSIGDWKEGEAE